MMKKGLFLVVVLGFVGTASAAEINLFWSTTGISDSNLMYYTAMTDFQPWFVPPTPTTGGPAGAYDLFLWGQFPADWAGYSIYGLDLQFQGNATHDVNLAYRQRGRWGAGPRIPLDGVMAAVTGGIVDTPGNLVQEDGAFLIGIARAVGTAGQVLTMALHTTPGLGIACRDANGEEVPDPTVTPATFTFVPEPASVLLVVAGALIRRR
jgi:hypothetical protein